LRSFRLCQRREDRMKKGKVWRKGFKYFLLFSLLGSLLVACSGASSAKTDTASQAQSGGTGEESKTGKTFTVGFDQEFPPMGFVDQDGSYTGYDLALAKEVAKRLNFTFVPKPINWDAKDLELNSGNIDCIWNGFTMEDREDKYTFVGPYMANRQVFVVAESSKIKNLSDLKGKTVEVQKDSSGLNALNREENKAMKDGFASLVEVGDYQTAMMDLESGACDAICMDSVVAEYQIKRSKKPFAILKDSLSEEKYGIGFKKGNTELADQVYKTLMAMKEDGTVDQITEKWFGSKDGFVLE
jgi:amino acid ABC superfamily ATP binding cassette transporter, binding protein